MQVLEMVQIAAGVLPVDFATGTAGLRTGDYVSLTAYDRLAIVLFKDNGTAGEDVTLTVEQATDATGTGAKALNFTKIYRKQATDLFTVGTWTLTTQSAANTYTNDTSAEQELLWVVDIAADELDVQNGFTYVRASINDIGTGAQLGCLFYLLLEPRYPAAPALMTSVIA